MKQIAVLISTYNGEKYIEDQINSILNQRFDSERYNLKVIVRDDGSTDNTNMVLQKIMIKHKNVKKLPFEKNLGFAKSFMTLLSEVESDYYFFSDQDDIWEPTKIDDFLTVMIDKEKSESICGVFSDAWIADQFAVSTGIKLLEERKRNILDGQLTFIQQIFETYVAGASLFINNNARNKVLEFDYDRFFSYEAHDYFVAIIISKYGTLYFLDKPTLRYRQTGNNVYGARDSKKKSVFKRIITLYSRVKKVQLLMKSGALIISNLPAERDLSETMLNISRGKASVNTRINFFWKYRMYVSVRYPRILAICYTLFTFRGVN